METITKLITIALEQAYEKCVIDWHPADGVPDGFQAEIDMTFQPSRLYHLGDYFIEMADFFCYVDAETFEVWCSHKIDEYAESEVVV